MGARMRWIHGWDGWIKEKEVTVLMNEKMRKWVDGWMNGGWIDEWWMD